MAKKIFITGAGGGFGKLTVQQLLANGHQVVGTMRSIATRNKEVAAELTEAGAHILEMDVTDTEGVNATAAKALEILGGMDVVINNAGVGVAGMQEHFTPEDFQNLFNVNVTGVQRVNRAFLPFLRQQHSGLLIYVSSLLGRITMPFYGPYNATKWALEAVAENYRVELSGFGIENAIVEPGGYANTFAENLWQPSDLSQVESYGDFMQVPAAMGEAFFAALQANPQQDPQNVAKTIASLVDMEKGTRPFRTTVDVLGMGAAVDPLNEGLATATEQIYGAFQLGHLLKVK